MHGGKQALTCAHSGPVLFPRRGSFPLTPRHDPTARPLVAEQPGASVQLGETGSPGLSPLLLEKRLRFPTKRVCFWAVGARSPEPTLPLEGRSCRPHLTDEGTGGKRLRKTRPVASAERGPRQDARASESKALRVPRKAQQLRLSVNLPETSQTQRHVRSAASSPGDTAAQGCARPDTPLFCPCAPFSSQTEPGL